jgi:MFS family permease
VGALQKRWFAFLLVHAFLLQALVMLLRIATTYQAVAIGLDALWIGIIGGAFGVVPAVFGLHVGRYIDRVGEPAALIAGSVAIVLSSAGLWLLSPTLATLLAMSTVMGLGQFIGVAGQHSAIGKSDISRRATDFGRLTMAISLAHAVGPSVIGVFSRDRLLPDTTAIFAASAASGVVLLAVAMLVRMPKQVPGSGGVGVWQTIKTLFATRGYVLATLASLVIFAAMDLMVIYLPLYGAEQGIGATTIGILLAVRAGASMISRFFFGQLLRALGRGRLLVLALVLSGISIALLTLTNVAALMALMLFATGLGLGVGAPLTLEWVSDIVDGKMRGTALSLRLAVNRVGQATLPVAVGALMTGVGAGGVIIATSASLLASAVLIGHWLRIAGRHRPRT